jgi:peptidoglycan/xylan/chitin deacetylase (PgdA/CDA1 family)
MRPFHLFIAGSSVLALLGCGNGAQVSSKSGEKEKTESPAIQPAAANQKVPPKRVSSRAANKNGSVFIVEYHHIRVGKTTMERAPADFERDLERMYKLGFRPIRMTDYLDGKIDVPPGASPVVFTFDDANPSQIQLKSDGTLDPACGLGMMKSFSGKHPDFPPIATFFVLPQMWGQPGTAAAKVRILEELGGELGNHTVTHPNLKKLSDEQVKRELAGGAALLSKFGSKGPNIFAMPLGISPKNKDLLKGFEFGGFRMKIRAAFLVGANPAPIPGSSNFDPYRIPRIQACKGPFGLDDWLDRVEKGSVKPYVAP